jgi:hypothetical protein
MTAVRLADLFRYYKALPHQLAAITELEAAIIAAAPTLLDRDQPWFKTWSAAGQQADLAAAIALIKEFEGCHLSASRIRSAAAIPGRSATARRAIAAVIPSNAATRSP